MPQTQHGNIHTFRPTRTHNPRHKHTQPLTQRRIPCSESTTLTHPQKQHQHEPSDQNRHTHPLRTNRVSQPLNLTQFQIEMDTQSLIRRGAHPSERNTDTQSSQPTGTNAYIQNLHHQRGTNSSRIQNPHKPQKQRGHPPPRSQQQEAFPQPARVAKPAGAEGPCTPRDLASPRHPLLWKRASPPPGGLAGRRFSVVRESASPR